MLSIVLNVDGIDNIPLRCVALKMIYRFRIIANALNILYRMGPSKWYWEKYCEKIYLL